MLFGTMAEGDISFELAKSYLKKSPDGGNSLYDHLTRVLSHIFAKSPENPYHDFEIISNKLKDLYAVPLDLNVSEYITYQNDNEKQERTAWYNCLQSLLTRNANSFMSIETEIILPQMSLYRNAGIPITEEEQLLLSGALRSLATATPNLKQLRFWGKFFGSPLDYYVIEGKGASNMQKETQRSNQEDTQEMRQRGLNKYTYWVSNSLVSQQWFVLPDATAAQLQIAARIKKILTGSLDKPIASSPSFPWLEKNYLRAIIDLISSDTIVCPTQWKEAAFTNGSEAESTNEPVDAEDLASIEMWSYAREPTLQPQESHESYSVIDDGSSYDRSRSAEVTEESSFIGRALDLKTASGKPGWAVRATGDQFRYGKWKKSKVAVVLRSLIWPGAINIFQDDQLLSIYIGYGHKLSAPPFSPLIPLEVQMEPEEPQEELGIQSEAEESHSDDESHVSSERYE